MMESVIDMKTGVVNPSAIRELLQNNATMPDIKNVIFSLKTTEPARDANGQKIKDENGHVKMVALNHPILATTIDFIDNTRVTVKNSMTDDVDTMTVMLDASGNVTKEQKDCVKSVIVATEASKELGIVYGIWKRLLGNPDNRGTIAGDGAGRILRDIVANAYDTNLESIKNDLKKAAAKAKHEEIQKAAKENADKNPSLAKTVRDLSATVEKLTALVEMLAAKQA